MKSFVRRGCGSPIIDEGRGDPVLLIHGFASRAHELDRPGLGTAADRGRLPRARFDNRRTWTEREALRLEDYGGPLMAEDARRLLDHEGTARADVMGYSMGARITAFLMLRHPARVRSAIFGGLGINMVRRTGRHRPDRALRRRRASST